MTSREREQYPSLKDVAERAGVSFQTVSKVLRGTAHRVPTSTRDRIVAAAAELGYIPNQLARGLVSRKTRTLGIVASDLGDWALSQFVSAVEREARAKGHAVIITVVGSDASDGVQCLRTLIEHRVDGIVAAAPHLEDSSAVADLLRQNGPAVSLQHVVGGGVSVVGSDHSLVGRIATNHLIKLGHRRIATITGVSRRRVTKSRLTGYRAALHRAGIAFDPNMLEESDWTALGGASAAGRLMDRLPGLTALVIQNDLMAVGAMSELTRRGRRIPDDVAVVGCDDLPVAAYTSPALTTVHIPFSETGEVAVATLLDHIQGRTDSPQRILLPVGLTVRESCGSAMASELA